MEMNLATQTEWTGEATQASKVLWTVPTVEEVASKFPQLEIVELLGRGGMGAVYKARQKELDRVVALKILPPEVGNDAAFAERFTREARALAKLHHPNVVTLFEFGRADGLFFFLMEYVDGVTLRQLLNTGRVSSREALAIVPQICDALQYAHDHGIVHRDIKPENILIDRRGAVKVADFGLAKLVAAGSETHRVGVTGAKWEGSLTDAAGIMGTPNYMAPEQTRNPAEVDHRADIYALGVVFYQMLTGELPGKEIKAPSKKVQIDVRLDEIVLRALESDPARRYEQASVLRTQIESVVASSGAIPPAAEASPVAFEKRWRDLWPWDVQYLTVLQIIPAIVLSVITVILVPRVGSKALWLLCGEIFFLGFAAVYTWVGYRVRSLRNALPSSEGEIAEGIVVYQKRQSPGVIVLHRDKIELMPIVGERVTIVLNKIASVREVTWFNGTKLWTKLGLIIETSDGARFGIALPDAIACRWRKRMVVDPGSRGEAPFKSAAGSFYDADPRRRRGRIGSLLTVLCASLGIAALWGYYEDLKAGQIGWFIGRLISVPAIALLLFWLFRDRGDSASNSNSHRAWRGIALAVVALLGANLLVVQVLRHNREQVQAHAVAVPVATANHNFETNAFLPISNQTRQLMNDLQALYQTPEAQSAADPRGGAEFRKKVGKLTAEIKTSLIGTAAEPLIKQQDAEMAKLAEAYKKNDQPKIKDISERVKALGRQIEAIVQPEGFQPRHLLAHSQMAPSVSSILAAIDRCMDKIEKARAAGLVLEMDRRLDEINEHCDQLQGKNNNVAPTAQDWNVDEETYRRIRAVLAKMENDAEGMRSVARHEKASEAERIALLNRVWTEQFLKRYAELQTELEKQLTK
jgi:predicted Ser/Thr protein kinase